MQISSNFNQGVEAARPVSPLNGSYHKVSTVVSLLLECSGLLPVPGHMIGLSRRRRPGSGVNHFSDKETQPMLKIMSPCAPKSYRVGMAKAAEQISHSICFIHFICNTHKVWYKIFEFVCVIEI